MAFAAGNQCKVVVDDVDLSGYFKSATITAEAADLDTTTFGNTAVRRIGGLKDGTVSLEGLYDRSTDASDEELVGSLAVANVVTVGPEGDTLGYVAKLLSALETSYEINDEVDGLVEVTAELMSDGGLDSGVWLHATAAETGAVNGTGVDNAALTSNGGVGHLHVTAFNGTNATIKIQHSTDNSSWADLITFTVATARTSQRTIVATGTTVNRYLRFTLTGTLTSITFSVAFARR